MEKFYTLLRYIVLSILVGTNLALSAKVVYFTDNDIRYRWDNTKTYVAVAPAGTGKTYVGDVTIPATVIYSEKTLSVTGVYSSAFSECTYLTSVTLPESVTSIGDYAFDSCEGLRSVSMPGVKTIGHWSFRNCYVIESLNFSDKLTSIGNYCFDKNLKITEVTLPATMTNIGGYAFEGNPQLKKITSLATTPPAVKKGYLDGDEIYTIFDDNDYGDRVLYVPAGTVQAYKSSMGWHHFQDNIKEISLSSIEDIKSSNGLAVQATGHGTLEVSADGETVLFIVNLNGQIIRKVTVPAGKSEIHGLPFGMMFVNGIKIIVK